MENEKCHLCGGEMVSKDINGTDFQWKNFGSVKLAVSFYALACSKCDEILIRGDQAESLDAALAKSFNNIKD